MSQRSRAGGSQGPGQEALNKAQGKEAQVQGEALNKVQGRRLLRSRWEAPNKVQGRRDFWKLSNRPPLLPVY